MVAGLDPDAAPVPEHLTILSDDLELASQWSDQERQAAIGGAPRLMSADNQRALPIDDHRERWRKGYLLAVRRRDLFEAWIIYERKKGREPSVAERVKKREQIKRKTQGS
jgi:hypothetical protein